jgi:secondary thiamine-phosphate synthase enzyme
MFMWTISIGTSKKKEVIDLTQRLDRFIAERGFQSGLCNVFITHTTAALTTADLDPGTDLDMLDAFTTMVPKLKYRHPHDPAHVPDHILATLIGPAVTLPVDAGRLILGTWQRVVLFEFDGPRPRQVIISLIGE